jgi:hypothetical protein
MGFEPSLFTQQLLKFVIPTLYIEGLLAYVVFSSTHCALDVVWF